MLQIGLRYFSFLFLSTLSQKIALRNLAVTLSILTDLRTLVSVTCSLRRPIEAASV